MKKSNNTGTFFKSGKLKKNERDYEPGPEEYNIR